MDDSQAGAASPEPRGPALSVVIPVRDGGTDLGRCLRGLQVSTWADYEVVVVDDGSADGSAELAASFGARVLRHDRPLGPAAARNAGAEAARAALVFFLDSDCVVHPDALAKAVARFEADPGLAALFGSYDDAPAAPGLVSQFRNLLHHYVHQQGEFVAEARPAHTFWTGCGAIRRRAFLDLGGFDPKLYRRPAIEDIELGYRLTRAGGRISLVRDIRATHLKRWTLRSMLQTDVFRRGVPWMLLMLRSKVAETDLNVSRSQRLSVGAAGLIASGLLLAPFRPAALLLIAAGVAGLAALNRAFYRFLAARRGWRFALAAFPLHFLYFCSCGASVAIAGALGLLLTRPAERPAEAPGVRAEPAEAATFPRPKVREARTRRPSPWNRP